jgi:signal transduction histidine kinase
LNPRLADLTKLISRSVAQHRALARQKGIRLDVNCDAGTPKVQIDSSRMTEAVTALLASAIRFPGPEPRIELQSGTRKDGIFISVRGGQALAIRDLLHPFDSIAKERRTPTLSEARIVWVLWSIKRIIEAHGGRLEIEGRYKNGSAFTLMLPASATH